MFRYYRKPFVAALLVFGAIQLYGTGAPGDGDKAAGQPAAAQSQQANRQPTKTASAPGKPTPTPALAQTNPATNELHPVPETFAETIEEVTPGQNAPDKVFAALQKAMDQNAGPNEAASISRPPANQLDNSANQAMGRMLISLAFVILLVLLCAWLTKHYLKKNRTFGGGFIEVLGSHALSQKSKLHWVRVGREHFLIGEGANSVSLISRLEEAQPSPQQDLAAPSQENAAEGRPIAPFEQRLDEWQQALQGHTMHRELSASLQVLGGLTKRLRRKKVQDHG